ncbi:MAG: hypothetical protein IID31_00980 [Planctomycetes bacterium]|nr:hypothetical protein [Planctomycetota bacterium]
MRSECADMEGSPEAVRRHLREVIRRVEQGGSEVRLADSCVPTGWNAVDSALANQGAGAGIGGLARGAVHEWLGIGEHGTEAPSERERGWILPMSLLMHLAARAIRAAGEGEGGGRAAVWIGSRCWPSPSSFAGVYAELLGRSIFLEPRDRASRLWAIELCLRSGAIGVVVADGARLGMAESRRVQLAAEAGLARGGGGIGLLARPAWECGAISAAATRWMVRREITPGSASSHSPPRPRWSIELSRCRGSASRSGARWVLEGGDETGVVCVPADVVDRPGSAADGRGFARSA